jgi:2-polyprenyl-6-methoxyphenol hydroxylase-like FAD-dependent oxidoreductase
MRSSTDVLVAGAGPVGLLLACELQRQGVDHLLIDLRPEPSYFCKALGVTPRTLEIFEDLGVVEDAIDAGLWLRGMSTFVNGVASGSLDMPAEDMPYGFLALPQYETERILEQCLERHGGAVRRGLALQSFEAGTEGVEARVADTTGAVRTVACRWLVGCDGARSSVRKGLGLSFEGDSYPMTFMLGDVEMDWDLPRGRSYRFQRIEDGQLTNVAVAVPVHGSTRRYRLSAAVPETIGQDAGLGVEASEALTLERLAEVMSPALPPGARLSSLHWSSTYRISHRIVPRYSVGPVFIAGDAAHIHPPIGGQGMNTGLQDAHNLAWKLVLAARGLAAPGLLESYSAERQPVGRDVVEQTSRAMDDAIANRPILQNPAARESQLFIGYRSSALVEDDLADGAADASAPGAGDRAPDASGLTRPFAGHPIRLRERLGRGRHVLVGYIGAERADEASSALADLLQMLRRRMADLASGIAIVAPDAPLADRERIPPITDSGGDFVRAYGARSGMVWLVRPDGHIGWRCDQPSVEKLSNYLDRIAAAPA